MLDVAVVWLHRDLRLHDNPALTAALLTARHVVVTYIWSPKEEGQFQPGRSSRWWLYHSLQSLDGQLHDRGNQICYRKGESAVEELLKVCEEAGSRCVFFNNVYDPLSLVRDHEVKQRLHAAGVLARSFNAELLYEPWEIYTDENTPHTTFKGFWNKVCHNMPNPPVVPQCGEPAGFPKPDTVNLYHLSLDDLELQTADELASNVHLRANWKPGTAGALDLLVKFLDNGLATFDKDRAKVDRESTSKLSPHIHFGEMSVRVIYHEAKMREAVLLAADPGSTAVQDYLEQLGYREYSRYLSFHFPFTHERSLLEHIRASPWNYCPMRFKAWRQGMTGYPVIDAAMRELWSTGWLHNRCRVIVASFMVKNLLLPWQWGLKHFWDTLLDADLECDALGWQYVAGCLQDAHPFQHLPDLSEESKRFDPDGTFVRRWIPALSKLPNIYIHEPWTAPRHVLDSAGVVLGEDYPMPIVTVSESRAALDHAWSIIEKCMVNTEHKPPEPYCRPTVPVDLKTLEPEEEVEQTIHRPASVSDTGESPEIKQSRPAAPDPVFVDKMMETMAKPGFSCASSGPGIFDTAARAQKHMQKKGNTKQQSPAQSHHSHTHSIIHTSPHPNQHTPLVSRPPPPKQSRHPSAFSPTNAATSTRLGFQPTHARGIVIPSYPNNPYPPIRVNNQKRPYESMPPSSLPDSHIVSNTNLRSSEPHRSCIARTASTGSFTDPGVPDVPTQPPTQAEFPANNDPLQVTALTYEYQCASAGNTNLGTNNMSDTRVSPSSDPSSHGPIYALSTHNKNQGHPLTAAGDCHDIPQQQIAVNPARRCID